VRIAPETKIRINDKEAALADLHVDDAVTVTCESKKEEPLAKTVIVRQKS